MRKVVDPILDQRVGPIAPWMIGVEHFSQGLRQPADHLGGDHVIDPFRDPAPGLLRHMLDDCRLVSLQRHLDEIEALVEQRLARSLRR
jgi:hypothetical protein